MKYINIQGLTNDKMVELQQFVEKKNDVMLLVETHLMYDKIKEINKDIRRIDKYRTEGDKKGGGLSIIFNKKTKMLINEEKHNNPDIMVINLNDRSIKIKIVLVYFSVRGKPEDRIRNSKIKQDIEKILQNWDKPLILIGDFNGHIQGIGYQREDENGRIILDFVGRYKLNLLNLDERCIGEATWENKGRRSTIDFVLVN